MIKSTPHSFLLNFFSTLYNYLSSSCVLFTKPLNPYRVSYMCLECSTIYHLSWSWQIILGICKCIVQDCSVYSQWCAICPSFLFICQKKDLWKVWPLYLDWKQKCPLACSLESSYMSPWEIKYVIQQFKKYIQVGGCYRIGRG